MNVATVAPLAAALMRADTMRVLVLLRPTMARFAPRAASASAAANPMPLVAPVIRICLSFMAQSYGHARNARSNTRAGLVELSLRDGAQCDRGYVFRTPAPLVSHGNRLQQVKRRARGNDAG